MDRLAAYTPLSGCNTIIAEQSLHTHPDLEPFTSFTVSLSRLGIEIPDEGLATIRLAKASVDSEERKIGNVRLSVNNLPVASMSVVQPEETADGVVMAYFPVEFSDRAAFTDPLSQPKIQLLNGVFFSDITVTLNFTPLDPADSGQAFNFCSLVFVMEVDGSKTGSNNMFTL